MSKESKEPKSWELSREEWLKKWGVDPDKLPPSILNARTAVTEPLIDTPPHTKLVQIPYANAVVFCNEKIAQIVFKHWQRHYPRSQLLVDFLNPAKLDYCYPSIDTHGRITFVKLEAYKLNPETEIPRRIGLLKAATVPFILQHDLTNPIGLIDLAIDFFFYDEGASVTEAWLEQCKNTKVPRELIDAIYDEVENGNPADLS